MPITREVAVCSRSVRLEHEDAAGCLLAATAETYDLTLVTAGERLLRGRGIRAAREPVSRPLAVEPPAHRSASAASRTRFTGCVSVQAKSTVPPDRAILG